MRPNASSLVLVLGSLSVAQAGVYDRNARLDRRQDAAASSAVNVASGLMGVVNRVLASATVTETVRQTITVGGDGAAGAVGNATVTVTIAETTITVTAGQAGGEASATVPGGALGAVESGAGSSAGVSGGAGAQTPRPPVVASGGVGVTVIEVPQEAIKTSKVDAAAPAPTTAPAVTSDPALASSISGATSDAVSSVASTEAGAPASSTDAGASASSTDAGASASATDGASSVDAASSTLQAPPGLSTDVGSASSLQPLPGLESSSLAVLPILETPTAAASTTAADAVSATSVPAAAASTTAAASSSAASLAPLPGVASSLADTLSLGGAGGAAVPTSLPVPDGAFGGVAGVIPVASAEVQPAPLPTITPGVANGADAGTPSGGVQIDVSGLTLSSQLNLGNLVQARQTGVPAAAGAAI